MKKIIVIILFLLSIAAQAQTYKMYKTENYHNQLRLNTKTGEVYQIQDDGQRFVVNYSMSPDCDSDNRYSLQKTENMWTFILLDRWTGKLWQTQFSVKGDDYRFSIPINEEVLDYSEVSVFAIEPMTSMYQFYLINQETGAMWKFQWSTKGDDYRWIEPM